MKKNVLQSIKVIVLSLVFGVGIMYVYAQERKVLTSDANGNATWQIETKFGGTYLINETSNPDICLYPNPLSLYNTCDCPTGFNSYIMMKFTNYDQANMNPIPINRLVGCYK